MSNLKLDILEASIEEEIDEYFSQTDDPGYYAPYLFERVNARIMSTIFTKEEKMEVIANSAAYFFEKGISHQKSLRPKGFLGKLKFLFSKESEWQ